MINHKPSHFSFKSQQIKILKLSLAVFLTMLMSFILFLSLYSLSYSKKIYPGVKIAERKFGGKTPEEVKKIIDDQISQVKDQNLFLQNDNFSQTISPNELKINYQPELSVLAAYHVGRGGSWPKRITERIGTLFKTTNLQVAFQMDKNKYRQIIEETALKTNQPVLDASCYLENNQVLIKDSQAGKILEINKLQDNIIETIGQLKKERQINLPVRQLPPEVLAAEATQAQSRAQRLISQPVTLVLVDDKKIDLGQEQIASWLEFIARIPSEGNKSNYILDLQLNDEKIKSYIHQLAQGINQEPKDAKLTIAGGRAVVWQQSQTGYQLDKEAAVKSIVNKLIANSQVAGISSASASDMVSPLVINLPISVVKPEISEDQIANLGIKELIGSGTTNFKGSPANRRSNIKTGADIFHGVIIKPGEEFSLLKNLGTVSEARGFKKDLVIKEDRTEPEVGGGLCQISTTMFRAALNSGLKITERSNHKYRVSYYEPPVGLDATIYQPSPDLKFINDTPGYILIQSNVSGNTITFEFYGTKDGREVYISNSEVYDYTSPGEPIYIDDPSLAPGETKYKEKAHQGAKAKVTYLVKRNGQEINKQVFYSKYVAWPAVILRGPGGETTEPPKEQSSQDQNTSSPPQEESQPPSSSSPTPSPTPTPVPTPTSS